MEVIALERSKRDTNICKRRVIVGRKRRSFGQNDDLALGVGGGHRKIVDFP